MSFTMPPSVVVDEQRDVMGAFARVREAAHQHVLVAEGIGAAARPPPVVPDHLDALGDGDGSPVR